MMNMILIFYKQNSSSAAETEAA